MPESLDPLLSRRVMPQARSNLAEQIIHAALRRPQTEEFNWKNLWQSFADLFILPQPALVFACALVIGLTLGVSYIQDIQANDLAARELASFITANNGFSGEFL